MAAGSKYAALAHTSKKHIDEDDEFDRRIIQPVRSLLRRGIADGTLRADIPLDVLFEMFTGLLEKALHLVMRGRLGVEQGSAVVVTVFLDGIGSNADHPAQFAG